jgi:hypothetical protein
MIKINYFVNEAMDNKISFNNIILKHKGVRISVALNDIGPMAASSIRLMHDKYGDITHLYTNAPFDCDDDIYVREGKFIETLCDIRSFIDRTEAFVKRIEGHITSVKSLDKS